MIYGKRNLIFFSIYFRKLELQMLINGSPVTKRESNSGPRS